MIKTDVCKDCQMCCTGKISGNKPCEYYTSTGCRLPWEERSYACRNYPYVVIYDEAYNNSFRVFLDVACPQRTHFFEMWGVPGVMFYPTPSITIKTSDHTCRKMP